MVQIRSMGKIINHAMGLLILPGLDMSALYLIQLE